MKQERSKEGEADNSINLNQGWSEGISGNEQI